jgi:thioesterase domain-containing protein
MDGIDPVTAIERKALLSNASPRSKVALVPLNQRFNQDQPILYCVHDLSCSANAYLPMARTASPLLHVVGVQAPQTFGKRCEASGSTFPASVADLASYYVAEVIEYQPSGPIIVGGWSIGAVIAMEMANQLVAMGRLVKLLVAIDGAPNNTLTGMKKSSARYYLEVASNFVRCVRRRDMKSLALSLYYKIRVLRKTVQREHPAVKTFATYREYLPHMQALVRRLYEIVDAYEPKGRYLNPVVVFEADEQPLFHLRHVGEVWQAVAPGAEIIRIDGADHRGLLEPPLVSDLVGQLARELRLCEGPR